jgi:hypothetical protein
MPASGAAQERIISFADLHRQLEKTSQERQENLNVVAKVLSTEEAQKLLNKAGLTPAKALKAVAQLDDSELSRVASQARTAEKDLAGGLIVGILALIGLIVVIIVVARVVSN